MFVRYYLPGYRGGGPIRTISNLVEQLSDEFEFSIVTQDREMGASEPYAGVEIDRWNTVGKARVFYCSPGRRSVRDIRRLLRDTPHDVVYLNSFFDPQFTLLPLVLLRLASRSGRQIVLAPRGELSSGALAIRRIRKAIYMGAMKRLGVYRDIVWQASSSVEASRITQTMAVGGRQDPRGACYVAPNLARSVGTAVHSKALGRCSTDVRLHMCFLSRISPMKNLDYALRVLSQVKIPAKLSIYGPQENAAYWEECSRLIATLPGNIQVEYCGGVVNEEVPSTLGQHDLLFFPTRGENFGHVIHEALGAGVPVLISDQTPWQDVEREGVGWALPLSEPSRFVAAIEEASRWTLGERRDFSRRAVHYALGVGLDPATVEANRKLFRP